jgi:hypothetical protein
MDEIIIEEKRYVSSKRAAQITGYAKDYVGQLCREGRVPARLVGRSWYVLESAIQDHRFGNPEAEPQTPEPAQKASLTEVWEPSRYEAIADEPLPPVQQQEQQIQDSWKEWFDRFNTTSAESEQEQEQEAEAVAVEIAKQETAPTLEEIGAPTESVGEEVSVPIHIYTPPPEELLPRYTSSREVEEEEELPVVVKRRRGWSIMTLKVAGVIVATLSAILAVIGSGYFDQYIISNNQVRIIAGVGLYNK